MGFYRYMGLCRDCRGQYLGFFSLLRVQDPWGFAVAPTHSRWTRNRRLLYCLGSRAWCLVSWARDPSAFRIVSLMPGQAQVRFRVQSLESTEGAYGSQLALLMT